MPLDPRCDFSDVADPGKRGPGKELFFENRCEFVEGGIGEILVTFGLQKSRPRIFEVTGAGAGRMDSSAACSLAAYSRSSFCLEFSAFSQLRVYALRRTKEPISAESPVNPFVTPATLVVDIAGTAGRVVNSAPLPDPFYVSVLFCNVFVMKVIVVEAAGVEPASENVTGQKTTCVVAFMPLALPRDVRGPGSERTRNRYR